MPMHDILLEDASFYQNHIVKRHYYTCFYAIILRNKKEYAYDKINCR